MSISLKAELDVWTAALKSYDEQDFEKALKLFSGIADSSKILTNMGLIYATIGEHEIAVEHFVAATNLDSYLAIAHFQCGVSNFLIERYDLALLDFEDAYLFLRGNEAINYEQIGLKFKLFSAEILFNRGLAQLNLGCAEQGISDMQEASRQKVTKEHAVIDEAIRDRGEGYTVFSIPVGVLYRPSENKIKNSKSKDYLGKAKLVAASDSSDAFTEFTGIRKLKLTTRECDNKREDGKQSSADLPAPNSSTAMAVSRPDAARHAAPERSKTTPRHGTTRPEVAMRRTQSVSNPANAPRPTGVLRSNTVSGRTNTTRVAGSTTTTPPTVAPLKTKTSQVIAVGTADTFTAEETGAGASSGTPMGLRSRPSLGRLQGSGTLQFVLQPASQPFSVPIHPGVQTQDVTPLVVPAGPVAAKGHLTQFYDSYMDVYTDGSAMPLMTSRALVPPPQRQEQEQGGQLLPVWVSSPALSPVSASSQRKTSTSSKAMHVSQNAGIEADENGFVHPHAGIRKSSGTADRGTFRWGPMRRLVARDGTACGVDDDEGFVAGDYEVSGMTSIRVKLHYQGDVRGMTIPPTTLFDEFIERVTTKFGTPLTGLEMKFVDEEGTKISLLDESDFELAIETARENAKRRSERKIEVWCVNV